MSGEKKLTIGIALVSILFLAFVLVSSNKQNERLSMPLAGEMQEDLGLRHVPQGTLDQTKDPRTSGDHYGGGLAGAGIHEEPVDDGLTLHSMEHGAVVLHYDPENLTTEQKEQLKEIFLTKFKGKKIMMPRENMSKPIIMTSWGQILKLDSIDEEKLVNFMSTNNDRAPEKVSSY